MCIRDRHQLATLQAIPRHGFRHKGKAQLAFDQREHLVGGGAVSYTHLDVYKRQS